MSVGIAILFLFSMLVSMLAFFLGLAALGNYEKMNKSQAMINDIFDRRIKNIEVKGKFHVIKGGDHE
jgi:hypothetical protein